MTEDDGVKIKFSGGSSQTEPVDTITAIACSSFSFPIKKKTNNNQMFQYIFSISSTFNDRRRQC